MSSLLTGRGLWCGHPHVFSLQEWDTLCLQSRQWGIQILHPKVADGANLWYDGPSLEKLRSIAVDTYHLQVVPWMFSYGNAYGAIQQEAALASIIGVTFGSVILDIEDAWSGHTDWAIQYGTFLRTQYGYTQQVYATVYCNPEQHPTPNEALNAWVDGFLPQVYFAEWTPNTASYAIDYFLPEWNRIQIDLAAKKQILKPILPVISLENHVPLQEITAWLTQMQYYGYCGFWYDGEYPLYAETIFNAPLPTWKTIQQPPVKETRVPTTTGIDQNLSESDLQVLWTLANPKAEWNPKAAIQSLWVMVVQHHPEISLGSATEEKERDLTLNGQPIRYRTFTSGRVLVCFMNKALTCIL
jgi:hypothetical protein